MSDDWNPIPDLGWDASPRPDEAEWIDFAEFDSALERDVVQSLLESAGIESFAPNQVWSRGTSFPLLLLLHPQDVKRAHALIETSSGNQPDPALGEKP